MRRAQITLSGWLACVLFFSGASAADTLIECRSGGYRYAYCPADARHGVELHSQASDTPCVFGDSWGYDQAGIWADKGCRGTFRVFSGRAPGAAPGRGPEISVPQAVVALAEEDDRADQRERGFGRADAIRSCAAAAAGHERLSRARSLAVSTVDQVIARGRRIYDVDIGVVADFDGGMRPFRTICTIEDGQIVRLRIL